ncbi:MAG: MFS transporter [Kouleothrix sp.]|nr:MFS transporter [Kouleothrix sp.]
MVLLTSLRHRSFALLWSGQTISRLGDSLYRVALAWWVLEKTGSAAAMGTVLIFSFAPMLLFLLIGGVAVDRFPRLRLMLASDALRGLVATAIAALAFGGQLEVWHIYVASIFFGFVSAFFQPAYSATIPDIMPRESLPSANSLTSLSGEITGIVGPALGAAIVALWGTSMAFALDALSFFISAACIIPLPPLPATHAGERATGVLTDLRAGLSAVFAQPWLWLTIAIFALVNVTASGPRLVALPFLVREGLHADVGTLGLLLSFESAGLMLGSIWLGRKTRLRHRGLVAYGASLLGGLAILAIGLPIGVPGVALALLFHGFTTALFSLIWTNTLQEMVPRELMGRVVSVDMLGSFVLLPVGFGVAGWATDLLGPQLVFLAGGALTMALIGLGLLHPAIRRLD